MIYDPAEHEKLTDAAFDRDEATAFIVDTLRLIDGAYHADEGWPLHPEDDYGDGKGPAKLGIYFGSAGTMWGLSRLAERYELTLRNDYRRGIERCEEQFRAYPRESQAPSYFMGGTGISLVKYVLTNDHSAIERCMSLAESNAGNPTREFMWGSPGTAFPALLLRDNEIDPRFDALLSSVHDELWNTWEPENEDGGLLWLQDLYGQRRRFIGAGHGAITNIAVFVRAFDLMDAQRREVFRSRLRAMLERYAMSDGEAVNWYSLAQPSQQKRMQWCHGAAGVITSLAALDRQDEVVEDLLRRGGNGIWRAGPLKKGPTLCHGTAGNGFALLQLAHRTGDDVWLDRACRFAAHAMQQVRSWRAEFGIPSASLWTGDLGVAIYVDAVLRNDPRILSHEAVG